MRILLVHPFFNFGGGTEFKTAVLLDLFTKDLGAEVLFVTSGIKELEEIEEFYGIALSKDKIILKVIKLIPYLSRRFGYFHRLLISHFTQKLREEYAPNLVVSAYDPLPGIEDSVVFLSTLWFLNEFNRDDVKSKLRVLISQILGFRDWRDGRIFISNSYFTQRQFEGLNIASTVVYPPVYVHDEFKSPWEERDDSFVYVGRIVPEKGIKEIGEIVYSLKREGFDIKCNFIGGGGKKSYLKEFLSKCNSDYMGWCYYHGILRPVERDKILGRSKFAISFCVVETFGLFVAECIRMGMIVFARANTGPAEILGFREELIFSDPDEAKEKIKRVLMNPKLQKELLKYLEERAKLFTVERFKEEVKRIILEVYKK